MGAIRSAAEWVYAWFVRLLAVVIVLAVIAFFAITIFFNGGHDGGRCLDEEVGAHGQVVCVERDH